MTWWQPLLFGFALGGLVYFGLIALGVVSFLILAYVVTREDPPPRSPR